LKGIVYGLIKVLSQHVCLGSEENHKKFRLVGVSADMRTEHKFEALLLDESVRCITILSFFTYVTYGFYAVFGRF
jgi:hypothetical protein